MTDDNWWLMTTDDSKETYVREMNCFMDHKKPMLEQGIVLIDQKKPMLEEVVV